MIHDLKREDVKAGILGGQILLIDVREPHEFAAGRIPGSISMPLSRFDPDALPKARGKRIVFSCAAGVRSAQALMIAQTSGIEVDTHYPGGFKDWALAGEVVEQG